MRDSSGLRSALHRSYPRLSRRGELGRTEEVLRCAEARLVVAACCRGRIRPMRSRSWSIPSQCALFFLRGRPWRVPVDIPESTGRVQYRSRTFCVLGARYPVKARGFLDLARGTERTRHDRTYPPVRMQSGTQRLWTDPAHRRCGRTHRSLHG